MLPMWKKTSRILALVMAVVVIVFSVGGIFGAWGISSALSDFTLKVFGVIQGGVEVVNSGVGRVDTLLQTARSEVQQAGDTVNSIAANLQENHPILTALNERVENRLGPGVEKIQEAMSPVHDAIVKVGGAVSFANSLPFVAERIPGLDQVDQTLTRLGTLGADLQQLRSTLRALADEKADKLTQAAEAALTDLVARIDGGLAGIQTDVQTFQADLTALQTRLQQRQSQLLLLYNLFAVLATLLFVWVIYSQVVVIRHHWSRPVAVPIAPPPPADRGAPDVTGEMAAPPSPTIEAADVVQSAETPTAISD
jgi:hypothetical protein